MAVPDRPKPNDRWHDPEKFVVNDIPYPCMFCGKLTTDVSVSFVKFVHRGYCFKQVSLDRFADLKTQAFSRPDPFQHVSSPEGRYPENGDPDIETAPDPNASVSSSPDRSYYWCMQCRRMRPADTRRTCCDSGSGSLPYTYSFDKGWTVGTPDEGSQEALDDGQRGRDGRV